jgi:hypothetical protein
VTRINRLKAELQTLELMAMNFRRKQRRNAEPRRFGKAAAADREWSSRDVTLRRMSYNAVVRLLIQVKR